MSLEQLQLSKHAEKRMAERFVNFERVVKAQGFKILPNKDSRETVQMLVKYSNKKNVSLVVNVAKMVVVTVLIIR